jgi:hypothetical protein
VLFVGENWAEAHHDVALMDATGRRLAKARLPEGMAGMARPHAMIGERHSVSGAKSDAAHARTLADMVRTDAHQLRPVAGDTAEVEAIKVVSRAYKTLIWERTRHTQRLRHALRDYFPAALEAFTNLDASDTLELLGRAPDPDSAARLSLNQIRAALKGALRRDIDAKATAIQAVLRAQHLGQPAVVAVVAAAYAATTRAAVAVRTALHEQVTILQGQVAAHFGLRLDAEVIGA